MFVFTLSTYSGLNPVLLCNFITGVSDKPVDMINFIFDSQYVNGCDTIL